MSERRWGAHEVLSRALAGAAFGCGVLLAADLLLLVRVWKPLYKSDPRWATVFLIAEIGLPMSVAFGMLAGLGWRRSHPFRLSPGGLIGCCAAVASVSAMLRPVVARVRTGRRDPLYEVVPDTMVAAFGLLALSIAVAAACRRLPRRSREPDDREG